MNQEWLQAQWPAPPRVRALCTSRHGGSSTGVYDTLNLGTHVGDAPASVAANRAALAQALGVRPVFLTQVHGSRLLMLDGASADEQVADAAMTQQPGLACTVMVADCLPLLMTDRLGTRVAAVHAGWRGLAGERGLGVLEASCQAFGSDSLTTGPAKAADLMVWLGPCIGPSAFEVGEEVRQLFVAHDPNSARLFLPKAPGKWLADLPGLARQRLSALGVTRVYGNDGSPPWCTVSQSSRFFSHRRDRVSGRMAACIWLA